MNGVELIKNGFWWWGREGSGESWRWNFVYWIFYFWDSKIREHQMCANLVLMTRFPKECHVKKHLYFTKVKNQKKKKLKYSKKIESKRFFRLSLACKSSSNIWKDYKSKLFWFCFVLSSFIKEKVSNCGAPVFISIEGGRVALNLNLSGSAAARVKVAWNPNYTKGIVYLHMSKEEITHKIRYIRN